MIDVTKIKSGDTITAEFVTGEAWGDQGFRSRRLNVFNQGRYSYIRKEHIIGHTPKPTELIVGMDFPYGIIGKPDFIKNGGKILAIDGDVCWIRCPDGRRMNMSKANVQEIIIRYSPT